MGTSHAASKLLDRGGLGIILEKKKKEDWGITLMVRERQMSQPSSKKAKRATPGTAGLSTSVHFLRKSWGKSS